MAWTTFRSEGGLLPPDMVTRAVSGEWGGQDASDFGISRGALTSEINAAWSEARAHWTSFRLALERLHRTNPTASTTTDTREWMVKFLRTMGFALVYQERAARTDDGQTYAISHRLGDDQGMPIHIVGVGTDLTRRQPGVMRLSPYATVQEYVNKTEHLWGLVTNGDTLWILRNSTRTARPTYLAWDLATLFAAEKYEDFLVLYRLCHVTRFPHHAEDGPGSWLERYTQAAWSQGSRLRERLRDGVEAALQTLGTGFLIDPANAALREAIVAGELTAEGYYQELLRLIYRLLFLMVAEERQMLLPPGDDETAAIYGAVYSLERLRQLADVAPGRLAEGMDDLWYGLLETFDLFAYHPAPGPLPVPALNGELFGPDALPHLTDTALGNRTLLEALRPLTGFRDDHVRRRVNYAGLDVEELGSVYESLLDFTPWIEPTNQPDAWRFTLVSGSDRKSTGSYYTQPELVQALIQSALEPVVAERLREAAPGREEETLLSLTICDPACGSGHFLLAAARRVARQLAQVRTAEAEPGADAYQAALRDVIEHCLYGVDKNPLAVDLCKVALWIEGHHRGRPLSFLDHRIRCGDSLVGAFYHDELRDMVQPGIPGDAYKAKTGDAKVVAQALKRENAAEQRGQQRWEDLFGSPPTGDQWAAMVEGFVAVDALVTDDPDQVQVKKRAYAAWHEPGTPWHRAWQRANLWVAPFFASLTAEHRGAVPTTRHLWDAHQNLPIPSRIQAYADALAVQQRVFHWPVEFPSVFQAGGFDVVLGNPPWERIKLQEEEWFQARHPVVAQAPTKAERSRRIAALQEEAPTLWAAFHEAKHAAEAASSFIRASGRYPLAGVGDVNTFAVFAELGRALLNPTGTLGIVVPTGIATDYTYRLFFRAVVEHQELVSLYDFENREGLFPAVDSRYKFSLLTLSRRPVARARFGFFLTRASQIHDAARTFPMAPGDLLRVNPNTGTCPVFRTAIDAELTRKIYERVPVLVNARTGENPWGIRFMRMFDMSNDSDLFYAEPGAGRLPLYEAKLIHQFDHRWATYEDGMVRDLRVAEKADVTRTVTPRYWVDQAEVVARLPADWSHRWFLGFRDIARATDERTAIASFTPRVAVGHTMPLMLTNAIAAVPALVANLNSLILDFIARQKVGGTHLTYFLIEQFPILMPYMYQPTDLTFIEERALELTYTAEDMQPFARDMGYMGPPFSWNQERRAMLRAELDAYYAHLYGLTRDELRYILDPQEVMGQDFPGETFRILKENDMREFGEYRTRRLVLEAYDALARDFRNRPVASPAG